MNTGFGPRKKANFYPVTASVVAYGLMLLLGLGSVGSLILCQSCAPSEEAVQTEFESILEDFYNALSRVKYRDLKEHLTKGDLKNLIDQAQDRNVLDQFCKPYENIELDEVKDVDLDDEKAKVKVKLKKDDKIYRQTIRFKLVEGKWKVYDLDPMEAQ